MELPEALSAKTNLGQRWGGRVGREVEEVISSVAIEFFMGLAFI